MPEPNSPAPSPAGTTLNVSEVVALHDKIIERVRTCYDPEIPVNIYDLGLIYNVQVEPTGDVHVKMTLTAPGCPAAGTLPIEVEDKITVIPGVKNVKVDVVWEPTWIKTRCRKPPNYNWGSFEIDNGKNCRLPIVDCRLTIEETADWQLSIA